MRLRYTQSELVAEHDYAAPHVVAGHRVHGGFILGEARVLTFVTTDGGRITGSAVLDPFWEGLLRWATVEQPALLAERTRAQLQARISTHAESARVLARFEQLGAA